MFVPPGLAAALLVLQEPKAVKCRGRFQFWAKLYSTRTVSCSCAVWCSSRTPVMVQVSWASEDEEQRKDKPTPGKVSKCDPLCHGLKTGDDFEEVFKGQRRQELCICY